MKFMTIVKGPENGRPPTDGIDQRHHEARRGRDQAGVFVTMGGLMPAPRAASCAYPTESSPSPTDRLPRPKEIFGGFAVYDVKSKDEAIEWARRFMELHREHWPTWEGETEVRPMMEGGPPPAA